MDGYTSMKQKLESTGLYRISQGTALHSELLAYADEIDRIYLELDELLRECFIPTATDYGITLREAFAGKLNDGLDLEERRQRLMAKERDAGSDCTYDGYLEFLRSLGLNDFSVTLNPAEWEIAVGISDVLSVPEKKLINEKIISNGPAGHLISINYN